MAGTAGCSVQCAVCRGASCAHSKLWGAHSAALHCLSAESAAHAPTSSRKAARTCAHLWLCAGPARAPLAALSPANFLPSNSSFWPPNQSSQATATLWRLQRPIWTTLSPNRPPRTRHSCPPTLRPPETKLETDQEKPEEAHKAEEKPPYSKDVQRRAWQT